MKPRTLKSLFCENSDISTIPRLSMMASSADSAYSYQAYLLQACAQLLRIILRASLLMRANVAEV